MPLPLPPQNSKPETKILQSSKIVPSDHDQPKKRGENYQAKISPSSPCRTVKKRSAFEDLTNASQNRPVQSMKEVNKEFEKYVSKKINGNTQALGSAQNNEMKGKRYKLELSPVVASTTLMPNMEKQLILDIATKSKTPTTEKASPLKKPLVLKKEPAIEETALIKKALKKHTNHGEVSLLEKSLSLQEETDHDDDFSIQPMTFGKKHKPEEAAITKNTLSLKKKMDTCQRKQSCQEELLTLQDRNGEKNSFFIEMVNYGKKPKAEESSPTKKPLPLKKKRNKTQGKVSYVMNPPVLQEINSEEKSLTKELLFFKRKHTVEESLFWKPSALQEKHTIEQEVPMLNKSLAWREKINFQEDSLFEDSSAFKKKPTTEEATLTTSPVFIKKKYTTQERKGTTQWKRPHVKYPLALQEVHYGEESFITKPLLFKKNSTTEEESLFQDPSSLQEKHTTEREVEILKKPRTLQESKNSKDNSFMQLRTYKKKLTTRGATHTKKPSYIKKQKRNTWWNVSRFRPLELQVVTSGEESLTKEPLSFKEENVSLKKKKCTTQAMPVWPDSLDWWETIDEYKNSFFREPESFRKKPTSEEEFLSQEPSELKEKHTTLQEVSLSNKPLALQEKTTTEEESYSKDAVTLKEKPTNEEEFFSPELFSLPDNPDNEDEFHFQKSLDLQEKTDTKDDSSQKLLVWNKEPSTEAAISLEGQLSLKNESTAQGQTFLLKKPLVLCESISSDKESLSRCPLALQEYPSIEEEALFKEPLARQEKPSIEKEATLKEALAFQEKPSTMTEVTLKKPNIEKKASPKESLALADKPSVENEAILKNPLVSQKYNIEKETPFKEVLALSEKLTALKELALKGYLILEENPPHEGDNFLNIFLITRAENKPHVSSNALESKTGKSSADNMSAMGKPSTTSKSNKCECGSKNSFLPQIKRTQEEMTTLEDIDEDHNDPLFNSIYAKEIFSYLKEREEKFILIKYMNRQNDITSDMRAILVDWLVEVQMTFEMSHETLYLAVKLVDHYLMKVSCKKNKLQLLGSTAFMIAAKFEEIFPPSLDDFLYICEDMYQRDEMLAMEMNILQTLKFDINIPIAYHFLRRYAMCLHASMKTLTLSRFICEMTLQKYDYVHERASKLAAASFLLALYMRKLGHWAPILEYYSGYKTFELHPLVRQLNILLTFQSSDMLKTVYNKYSQQVFFEVTKTPLMDMSKLEEILSC